LRHITHQAEEKEAALLYILENMIEINDERLCMIFAPTKHHVDYLHELLKSAGIQSTYIYGSLDQSARKIHLARFRAGRVRIMIVTDVAARGIDIPLLDYVINFEFPGSPKVFVHRVGRVARAGRTGTAITFVSTDELPFLVDLQLFLARPLILGAVYEDNVTLDPNYSQEIVLGKIPSTIIGLETEKFTILVKDNAIVVCTFNFR
jgi:ATP-dependent RNA helicase DDX54/DBP10